MLEDLNVDAMELVAPYDKVWDISRDSSTMQAAAQLLQRRRDVRLLQGRHALRAYRGAGIE